MKSYHLCAIAKNRNTIASYLLAETDKFCDSELAYKKWHDTTPFAMQEFVKRNLVQGLIWENNRIKVKFTEEEISALQDFHYFSNKSIETFEKEYLNRLPSFKERHMHQALNTGAITCSIADEMNMLRNGFANIVMYGYVDKMFPALKELCNITKNDYMNSPLFLHHCNEVAQGIGSLSITVDDLYRLLSSKIPMKYTMLFDTSAIKHVLKTDKIFNERNLNFIEQSIKRADAVTSKLEIK